MRVNVKSRLLADAMALNARLLKMAGVSIADTALEPVSFCGCDSRIGVLSNVTVYVNVKSRLLADAMALNARLLKMVGVSIEDATSEPMHFSGVPLAFGPMVAS